MRRLGQHFLSDPAILARIADALDPQPGETVVEIGAGRGTLTDVLLARGLKVIAIEKDHGLAAALGTRENLTVVTGDALKVNWPATKVIGNIPYYITSPLIDKALTPPLPERIVFLVQDEVADRIAAQPGGKTYGALSVDVEVAPLRAFVTACFSKRRKQLKNAVPGLTEAELQEMGFDPTVRPERLPPEAFVRLLRRASREGAPTRHIHDC